MAALRFNPSPELRSRVVAIDVLDQTGESVVFPSCKAVLGVQFAGSVKAEEQMLSQAGVTGLQRHTRTYTYGGGARSVLVTFTPQGLNCLGVPAHELSDRNLALTDLFERALVERLCEQLCTASEPTARVAVIERWLRTLAFARDARITHAVTRLTAESPPSIATLARELELSERQLERRFLERVGVSPKRFAKLARFERILALMAEAPTLTHAAAAAGYYDQSHFVRDFQSFTGAAPSQVLRLLSMSDSYK